MSKDPTSISDVLKDIAKKYDLRIGSLSEVADEVSGLTTGNLAIDYLTGVGGLPRGRITELYGQPSAGKTTTALQAAAALQRDIIASGRDEFILYQDFEHAMDGEYAAALGLDVEHNSFLLVQPNWLEEGAGLAEQIIKTGKVRLSIWDSVAEMTPRELEFGVRTNAMERARLMNSLLQRFNSLFHQYDCCGVFLNHMTEAIQMSGRPGMPPQETSPGGKALKFYASLRLAFKQIKNVRGAAGDVLTGETSNQVVATHVKVQATKNKVGIPFRTAEVRVRFGKGFDNAWSAVQVLLAHGVVKKQGAWYRFDPSLEHPAMHLSAGSTARPSLQGEAQVLRFADEYPDWRDQLVKRAIDLVAEHGGEALVAADDLDDDS